MADRQPRVKPIAITMVVASTISTKHATKVETIRAQVAAVTQYSSCCSKRYDATYVTYFALSIDVTCSTRGGPTDAVVHGGCGETRCGRDRLIDKVPGPKGVQHDQAEPDH